MVYPKTTYLKQIKQSHNEMFQTIVRNIKFIKLTTKEGVTKLLCNELDLSSNKITEKDKLKLKVSEDKINKKSKIQRLLIQYRLYRVQY